MKPSEIMFQRVLENRCPISNTEIIAKDETVLIDYNGAKLKVKKQYVRYNTGK